jgi:hypothetical protein
MGDQMSKHHPTIGGKGRAAHDRPPRPQNIFTHSAQCPDCHKEFSVLLLKGKNDIYHVCDCGSFIRIKIQWDGFYIEVESMTSETVSA